MLVVPHNPSTFLSSSSDPNRDPYGVWTVRNQRNKEIQIVSLFPAKGYKSSQWSQTHIQTAAHNPEVGGSSPPPATNKPLKSYDFSGLFSCPFPLICFVPAVWSKPRLILTQAPAPRLAFHSKKAARETPQRISRAVVLSYFSTYPGRELIKRRNRQVSHHLSHSASSPHPFAGAIGHGSVR